MSEFNWWLLIVGLVVGAGLVWLILADFRRRESDIARAELPTEAAWIAATMRDGGQAIDEATAERVLRLHRTYLASLPPDELDADRAEDWDDEPDVAAAAGEDQRVDAAAPGTTPVWTATDPSPRRR
jgi:hypothetical protein